MKIHNKGNTYYKTWYTIALLLQESQTYIYIYNNNSPGSLNCLSALPNLPKE